MNKRILTVAGIFSTLLFVSSPVLAQDAVTPTVAAEPNDSKDKAQDVLGRTMKDIEGKDQDLSQYKGKVVLIVNVASKCGYTGQYKGLEALYQKYKDRGFVILGFPANNFGGQEPGSSEDIKKTCFGTYQVTFPMFEKISVKGADASELYQAIAAAPKPQGEAPKWNFTKYLLNSKGEVVSCFGSRVKPDDEALEKAIEELLESPEATEAK